MWSGLYVVYNPVVSFDLRCQSGIHYKLLTLCILYKIGRSAETMARLEINELSGSTYNNAINVMGYFLV